MNKEEYGKYLKSEHWEEIKRSKTAKGKKRCSICATETQIDLHHLNYKKIFDVQLEDLRWLCRRCHFTAHELINNGTLIFYSENHHSKFALTKIAVKKKLGMIGNMFNK